MRRRVSAGADWAIKEASSYWWLIGPLGLWVAMAFGLKGQPFSTYVLSYMIGCLPLSAVGSFRPYYNPYVNIVTQRDRDDLTAEELESLKVFKGAKGKQAILKTLLTVGIFLFSLYLVRDNSLLEALPIGRHMGSNGGILYGSFLTFFVTIMLQVFFWARAFRKAFSRF
jgi:hypothetical protein